MLCKKCEKRATCKKLCKKAEAYVNQDYISLREQLTNKALYPSRTEWPTLKKVLTIMSIVDKPKSKKDLIYELHFKDRMPITQIANHLEVSHPYVSKVVHRILNVTIRTSLST